MSKTHYEEDEHFIFTANAAERSFLKYQVNSADAARTQEQRFEQIEKAGGEAVSHAELHDVASELALGKVRVSLPNLEVDLCKRGLEGYVKIGGEEVRGLQKFTLICEAGRDPIVQLELLPVAVSESEAQ